MLSAVNISENRVHFSTYRYIDEADFEREAQRTRIQPGDVLLTIVGAIGRVAVVPKVIDPFTLQRSVAVLTPIQIDSKFLMYQLESPRIANFFKANARGTAQKGVYLKTLGTADIWFPSLTEQRRIVTRVEELFSELDKGIEYLKTAREQLKVYRQALLKHVFEGKLTERWRDENKDKLEAADELLARIKRERETYYEQQLEDWKAAVKAWEAEGKQGKRPTKPQKPIDLAAAMEEAQDELPSLPWGWVWLPLDMVASAVDPQPSHRTPPKQENGIPYVGVGDIDKKTGKFDFSSARKVSEQVLEEHKDRYDLKDGDFIIGKIGTIGKPFSIPSERFYALSANVVLVKPGARQIDFRYLFMLCGSSVIEKQFEAGSNATTQPAFGIKKVRLLMLPVCSGAEQDKVVSLATDHLEAIEQNEKEIADALARADTLRQSILKQAFSGQLVGQDPSDEPASVLLERIAAEKASDENPKKKSKKKDAA